MLGAVRLASFLPWLGRPRAAVALLGRSGLLVFLSHRVVVQAVAHVLGGRLPAGWLTAGLILAALMICGALAYVRETQPRAAQILKRFGV